jgi:hypothetical protein
MQRARSFALSTILAVLAAGCGGAAPAGSGAVACPALALVGPQMISPASGATNVSTAIGALTFSSTNATSVGAPILAGSDGSRVFGSLPALGSNGQYTSAIPALTAHLTYTVTWASQGTATCPIPVGSSGSFST